MSSPPVVSVIICTRNRADSLRETLASMARLRVPEDMPAELLVVDNGSTDHTRQVVEEARLPDLPLRYVFEPLPGQSRARNRGMAESQGTIFLWTDDDVRVPEDWIEGMCRPILNGEADVVAGSIAIAPHLHRPWMTHLHLDWLVHRPAAHEVEHLQYLVGANMAFHRRVAEATGGFETELGPGACGYADDTLMGWKALQAGFRIIGSPARVEHHFDPGRLSRRHWLRDALKRGASIAYVDYHWRHRTAPSRWRVLYSVLSYIKRYLLHPGWLLWREGAAEGQLHALWDVGYWSRLYAEASRPRRYDSLGLRPRGPAGPETATPGQPATGSEQS